MPLLRSLASIAAPGQMKPTGVPVLDYAHPLAVGLIAYWFDHGMGGLDAPYVELIGRRSYLNWTTATQLVGNTQFGAAIKFAVSSNVRYSSDAAIRNLHGAPPWCIACGICPTTMTGTGPMFSRLSNGGATAPFSNWKFQSASSTLVQAFINSGGTLTQIASNATFGGLNTFNTFLLNATSATACDFYVNGLLVGGNTGLTIQNGPPNDEIAMMGNPSDGLAGSLYYGAIWARALTKAEIFQLHYDPYCFLTSPEYDMPALFTPAPPPPPAALAGVGGAANIFQIKRTRY